MPYSTRARPVASGSGFDPHTFLTSEGNGRRIARYEAEAVVFAQGDSAVSVYYVLEGRVRLSVISETGQKGVLTILGRNEFFGHLLLAGQAHRDISAITLIPSILMRIDRAVILRTLREEPALSDFFLNFLVRDSIRMQEDLLDHLFNSSEKRLARALVLLADFANDNSDEVAVPQISQEILGHLIGTTRSRISVFMRNFRRLGLVDYDGERMLLRRGLLQFLNGISAISK